MTSIHAVLCVQNNNRLSTNVIINNLNNKITMKDICKLFLTQIETKSNPFIKILNKYIFNDQHYFKNFNLLIGKHIENITEKQLTELFTDCETTMTANLDDKFIIFINNFQREDTLYIMLDSYENTINEIFYDTTNLDMSVSSWKWNNRNGILQYQISKEYEYVKIENTNKNMKIINNYGILSIDGNIQIYELLHDNWKKICIIDSLDSSLGGSRYTRIKVIN